MLSRMMSPFFRCFAGPCLLALGVLAPSAHAQVNLIANGSFEAGVWDGTASFVDSNNASALMFWNNQASSWVPDSNSTWVQDATRASDGSRFVWLGPPGAPYNEANTYVSQTVPVLGTGAPGTALVAGAMYHLSLDHAFFDPNDPTNSMNMDSTLQIYYMLGNAMNMGDPNNPMLTDNPSTLTALLTDTGTTESWASVHWTQAGVDFQMPDTTGYDYLRIFIAAPANGGSTPSMGVLVDNVSLVAVPEPSSLLLLGVAFAIRRRRRQA